MDIAGITPEDMASILEDYQGGMSDFQDDYLVTYRAGGGTAYGQYHQACREFHKRTRGIQDFIWGPHGIKRISIKIRKLERLLRAEEDELVQEELRVKITHAKINLELVQASLAEEVYGWVRFGQQAVALKAIVGDLSKERRRELEREMWLWRGKEILAQDFMATGRPRPGSLEYLHSMPTKIKQELIRFGENPAEAIKWYTNGDHCVLDFEGLTLPHVSTDELLPLLESRLGLDITPGRAKSPLPRPGM